MVFRLRIWQPLELNFYFVIIYLRIGAASAAGMIGAGAFYFNWFAHSRHVAE